MVRNALAAVLLLTAVVTRPVVTVRAHPVSTQTPAAPAPVVDPALARAYQEQLANISRDLPPSASLSAIWQPLFRLAADRSRAGSPIDENRAALAVTAAYVMDWPVTASAPEATDWPRPRPRRIHLAGRRDLAQHFAVSALISAMAGSPVADVAGFYKEMADMKGASGFSFSDVAANRAGVRFGDAATSSAASARRLQQRVASGVSERDIMPSVADLPDNLTHTELMNRFGGVGGEGYSALLADIDRRVADLAVHR
jgi:hypothetical protein